MKRIVMMFLSAVLCFTMFSCGEKEPTYESILADYTEKIEASADDLAREAEEEVGEGADGYAVYMDKIEVIADLNTDGGLEMAELFNADLTEENEAEYKENIGKLSQVYRDSCEDIADACGFDH